ncbi:MAG: hypothetical protein ACTSPO_15500 [Candidatus Heimdallarchaeaceae archaeon]
MKIFKTYQGVDLPKNQAYIIDFLQKGSNNWWEAYYMNPQRKPRKDRPIWTIASWFNRHLSRIHKKGLLKEVPFVYGDGRGNFIWSNPGINASRANFQALTLHNANMELKSEQNKII